MINPYNYLFFLVYKYLDSKKIDKENFIFGVNSILALIIIVHFIVSILILPKMKFITDSNFGDYKWVFGAFGGLSFVLNNYIFFERKERYKKVIIKIRKETRYKKNITLAFIILYLFIPFYLYLFFYVL